jgi:hypothetical protein
MSKPNLLGFASSLGIYRNKRIRDLHRLLRKAVPIKIDFCELSPVLFQVTMAYAGENQIDGNFEGYDPEDWIEIFASNHVNVTLPQVREIIKAFHTVGLYDKGKLRSWMKYNRHLADYDNIVKAKRQAGKLSAKKRMQEARESLKNGKHLDEKTEQEAPKNGSISDSVSKQIWLIKEALEQTSDKAKRKELLAQKKRLLSQSTGVDLSAPTAPKAARSPALLDNHSPPPQDPGKALLNAARACDPELLTEKMVRALYLAGDDVPALAKRRFSKLLEQLEEKEARNPVPG